MKKGDIVTIEDGSFVRSVIGGKLVHERLAHGKEIGKHYVVVETGCKFPNTGSRGYLYPYAPPTFNNTVIQALDSGKVVFIEECFLQVAKPKRKIIVDVDNTYCVVTGEMVEVSDDLYQKIKHETE